MAYVMFSKDGSYEFYENCYINKASFREDASHMELLDFIYTDLTDITEIAEQYISNRINLTTFERQNQHSSSTNELDILKKSLCDKHRFYKYAWKEATLQALNRHFQLTLAYIAHENIEIANLINSTWYKDRLSWLLSDVLSGNETEFYHRSFLDYCSSYAPDKLEFNDDKHDIEYFAIIPPDHKPVVFDVETALPQTIRNMLYCILDVGADEFKNYEPIQRYWVYKGISRSDEISAKRVFSISYQGQNFKQKLVEYDAFSCLKREQFLHIADNGIPVEAKNDLHKVFNMSKQHSTFFDMYEIETLQQLLRLEVLAMIQSNTNVKICKNCRKYFVVKDPKGLYCERKNKNFNNAKCSEIGAYSAFKNKLKNDELFEAYNRASKTHSARKRKGKMTSEEYKLWFSQAKEKLNLAQTGKISKEAFYEWLKI